MQQPLTRDHVRQRGPALEGAEHRAFGGVVDGILFHFGTVRGVPRVVGVDIAIKNVGENLLIGGKQPALQRAGIGMRPQPLRSGSRRAAADAVGIDHADVRIEPAFAILFKTPQAVEERLHCRHFIALPRLHLRGRPVDRVDLRARSLQRTEEAVARPFVNIVEMVAIQIFQHRGIPRQRLFAWEVAFNHRAAPALNGRALLIAHCSFGDIAERNGWPNLLACGFQCLNLLQPLADAR